METALNKGFSARFINLEALEREFPEISISTTTKTFGLTSGLSDVPVDASKVTQIIQYEAQQNVPYPINEVVWDYQLVGAGANEQIEVVLVAIKSDLLEAINAAVESARLRPNIVGVATMSDERLGCHW